MSGEKCFYCERPHPPCEECNRRNKHWLWNKLEGVRSRDVEKERQKQMCVDNFTRNFTSQLKDPNSRLAKQIDRQMDHEYRSFNLESPSIFSLLTGDKEYHAWKCMTNLSYDYRWDHKFGIQKEMDKATEGTPIRAKYDPHYYSDGITISWNGNAKTK